jgi:hypothetical protein
VPRHLEPEGSTQACTGLEGGGPREDARQPGKPVTTLDALDPRATSENLRSARWTLIAAAHTKRLQMPAEFRGVMASIIVTGRVLPMTEGTSLPREPPGSPGHVRGSSPAVIICNG